MRVARPSLRAGGFFNAYVAGDSVFADVWNGAE